MTDSNGSYSHARMPIRIRAAHTRSRMVIGLKMKPSRMEVMFTDKRFSTKALHVRQSPWTETLPDGLVNSGRQLFIIASLTGLPRSAYFAGQVFKSTYKARGNASQSIVAVFDVLWNPPPLPEITGLSRRRHV